MTNLLIKHYFEMLNDLTKEELQEINKNETKNN